MSSEELIRELCARALIAEGVEFTAAAAELHAALRAHIDNLRAMAATALLNPPPTNL